MVRSNKIDGQALVTGSLPYSEWPLDFLVDYVVYVHHGYLRQTFTTLRDHIENFVAEHPQKYTYSDELLQQFMKLQGTLPDFMKQQEELIFPYVKQVSRAYQSKESFAGLLTRTLRKPVEKVLSQEHQLVTTVLQRLRELTNNYNLPGTASNHQTAVFMKLHELDNDLAQHLYLENKIVLPRLLAIESELNKQ